MQGYIGLLTAKNTHVSDRETANQKSALHVTL